jgi:hypothetical protein
VAAAATAAAYFLSHLAISSVTLSLYGICSH